MKRQIKSILFVAGAFGIVAAASTTSAYACGGKGQHGAARLLEMDTDGNGAVDRSELTNGMYKKAAERLAASDANSDGYLDQSEIRAQFAAKGERKGKRQRSEQKLEKFKERGKKRFARMDKDEDGRLSLAELQGAADHRIEKMIERLDGNGDGAISADEIPTRRHRGGKKSKQG